MKPYQVYEAVSQLIEIELQIARVQSKVNRFLQILDPGHWLTAQVNEIKAHTDVIPSCKHLLDRLIRELGSEIVRKEQKDLVSRLRIALDKIAELREPKPGTESDAMKEAIFTAAAALSEKE